MPSWRRSNFLEKHRVLVVGGTLLLALAGLPLLYFLKFDFNPINLRNPKAELIAPSSICARIRTPAPMPST